MNHHTQHTLFSNHHIKPAHLYLWQYLLLLLGLTYSSSALCSIKLPIPSALQSIPSLALFKSFLPPSRTNSSPNSLIEVFLAFLGHMYLPQDSWIPRCPQHKPSLDHILPELLFSLASFFSYKTSTSHIAEGWENCNGYKYPSVGDFLYKEGRAMVKHWVKTQS